MGIWNTKTYAKSLGLTHHARYMGVLPGFYRERDSAWLLMSDILLPLQAIMELSWVLLYRLSGEEPRFMWAVGKVLK